MPICSFTAFAVAFNAPHPPAEWSYRRIPGTLRCSDIKTLLYFRIPGAVFVGLPVEKSGTPILSGPGYEPH